jgi:monodechloroaminopyrrolnitrin synthase
MNSIRSEDFFENCKVVKQIDPLNLDTFLLGDLPEINARLERSKLERFLESFRPQIDLQKTSREEAQAITRDLNLLFCSATRHKIEFHSCFRELLLGCSSLTDEVPTDTVYTYGVRNPDGSRERSLTTFAEERVFIKSLKSAMARLPEIVEYLFEAGQLSCDSEGFVDRLRLSVGKFGELLPSMKEVFMRVSPDFFTEHLRPFFDSKEIGGKTYLAAGGAQMPLILVDYLLWGASVHEPMYRRYLEENVEYQPPRVREWYHTIKQRSLIEKIIDESTMERGIVREQARELTGLFEIISKFRKPHYRIATMNMNIRSEGSVGSGGYTTDILELLMDRTQKYMEELTKLN